MKTNYVIATWSGNRRLGFDFGNYLHNHLLLLKNNPSHLSQITIVWPNNRDLFSYKKYMKGLHGSDANGIPIKVIETKNECQSYGQYIFAFKTFGSSFDYYIFTEDDYAPACPEFDQILIEYFDRMYEQKRCGYLCGFTRPCSATKSPWASVSWGISKSTVLSDVGFNIDQLKRNVIIKEYGKYQLLFSNIFLNAQYTICDVANDYEVSYYKEKTHIKKFGKTGAPDLLAPVQTRIKETVFSKSFIQTHEKGLRLYK